MNSLIRYTACGSAEAEDVSVRKTPLTSLVRAAQAGRSSATISSNLTLASIRDQLVDLDSLDRIEAADHGKGIFGWLERRRRSDVEATAVRTERTLLMPAATIFATSRR